MMRGAAYERSTPSFLDQYCWLSGLGLSCPEVHFLPLLHHLLLRLLSATK